MNKYKTRKWLTIGSILCAFYVILGAFGAHGLEKLLTSKELATYETGLKYLIIHSLGLVLINLSYEVFSIDSRLTNYWILGGMLFFSLSLIIHAVRLHLGIETKLFAMLAPIGGIFYIAGWISFAYNIQKK